LIEALSGGGELARLDNLSYRDRDGVVRHNELAPLDPDLDQWPDPDWSLVDGHEGAAGQRFGPGRVVPILTSRGPRYRSVERVRAEMARYDLDHTTFSFLDEDLAASPRRTRALLAAIRSLPGRTTWTARVRADVARDEALLDEMAASGAETFHIALESVNRDRLRRQRSGQALEQLTENLRRIRKRNIAIHGVFVLGRDGDTFDTPEHTLAFARQHELATVQFQLLTPLPGSRTFARLEAEGRLLFHDWSLYDGHHVVFRPRAVTPRELQRWQLWGHENFYGAGMVARSLWRGQLHRAAVAMDARRSQHHWIQANAGYLEALERLSAPRIRERDIPFRREFPELRSQISRASQLAG
jgi:radical SAM superfamily enzyme YgiQ (UPF0313 family)